METDCRSEEGRLILSPMFAALERLARHTVGAGVIFQYTMRVELIGHFKPCMTEFYLQIFARMFN